MMARPRYQFSVQTQNGTNRLVTGTGLAESAGMVMIWDDDGNLEHVFGMPQSVSKGARISEGNE
jgi:hypothetical protein